MSKRLNEVLDLVLRAIERLPNPPRERLKQDLVRVKEMILDSRPPRIMIVGRRGAGKSSLINAIFNDQVAEVGAVFSETGTPSWHTFQNAKGSIRILDTRGFGDLTQPQSSTFRSAMEEIEGVVSSECPDALLFLCKAKEVDARIAEDLQAVAAIQDLVKRRHDYAMPLVAVATQVDELDPKRISPPFEHEQKRRNIDLSVQGLSKACSTAGLEAMHVIPVAAYAEYEARKLVDHCYWNIDTLVEFLMKALPKSAQLQLARLSSIRKVQVKFARVLVATTASICAGLAAVPIPVADLIPITAAQIGMVTGIGYISGREMSRKDAKEFLAALGLNVGAGYALREAARALIKFVFPGGGSLISAGVAAAGTWGIGEAAIAYCIEEKSVDEAKQVFTKAKKEHESPSEEARASEPEAEAQDAE